MLVGAVESAVTHNVINEFLVLHCTRTHTPTSCIPSLDGTDVIRAVEKSQINSRKESAELQLSDEKSYL